MLCLGKNEIKNNLTNSPFSYCTCMSPNSIEWKKGLLYDKSLMTILTLHSNVSRCHHLNVCCQVCTKLKTTCPWTPFTFTSPSLLLNERVGNGFHSVSWTDKNYRGSSTHNQSQSSCVLSQFVGIVWIWKKKDLEDRIWSNKFQKSWSLIRLFGSSGSDKIENL